MSAGDRSQDPSAPILIVTALREEASALLDGTRGVARISGAPQPAWRGHLSGQPIILAQTGVGPRNARAGLAELLRWIGPCRWIGAGLAAGLAPDLIVGKILVADAVGDAEGAVTTGPDPAWAARALACDRTVRSGRFLSTARIAATRTEKAALRGTGGEEFDVLDMESASWARGAADAANEAPYLLARVVSDSADEELPDFLTVSVASDGSLDRGRIARYALLRPSAIGKLLDLRRRARSCAESLAEFLDRFAVSGF